MSELNRRDFLAGSMAAALPHVASAQAGAEPVTVGMIGTGARGTFLLDAILPLPGVAVKALCDIVSLVHGDRHDLVRIALIQF